MAAAVELRDRANWRTRPRSAQARAWNQRIRATVRPATPDELPFFCECGIEYCHASVWLTLQQAADVIDGGGMIIGSHFYRALEDLLTHRRADRD